MCKNNSASHLWRFSFAVLALDRYRQVLDKQTIDRKTKYLKN
jgi:hypothetical protein